MASYAAAFNDFLWNDIAPTEGLINRVVGGSAEGFWELIGSDGLYMTRHHMNQC